ncbi:MAG: hypothetical protein Q9190_007764, partial [Brigantiaea leucoxantha]
TGADGANVVAGLAANGADVFVIGRELEAIVGWDVDGFGGLVDICVGLESDFFVDGRDGVFWWYLDLNSVSGGGVVVVVELIFFRVAETLVSLPFEVA